MSTTTTPAEPTPTGNTRPVEQPKPTPALSAPTRKAGSPSVFAPLGPRPTTTEVASAVLCCPLKCPVCCCDTACHACYLTCGPNFMPDGSLDGLLHDQRHEPATCTELVSCFCFSDALCGWFNRQDTDAKRERPRLALGLVEMWGRETEKEGCVYWTSQVLCAPCTLPCIACWAVCGCFGKMC
ncbi:hypothetical protein MKEN_00196600 [Mycena kentingensis (nom. inval.)]|nr:hypothetical protein MKEN_00196600 [Mycena kentingensis (nom. inval.)]